MKKSPKIFVLNGIEEASHIMLVSMTDLCCVLTLSPEWWVPSQVAYNKCLLVDKKVFEHKDPHVTACLIACCMQIKSILSWYQIAGSEVRIGSCVTQ